MKFYSLAYPSLALIKYWGKMDEIANLPDTPSLAVTLDTFFSKTYVDFHNQDEVFVNGKHQKLEKFIPVFDFFRQRIDKKVFFSVNSSSNFPISAGFASSSSGFCALVHALNYLCNTNLTIDEQSAIARVGSASSARSFYGGFTLLGRGDIFSKQLYSQDYWPELRIIAIEISADSKKLSSTLAMNLSKKTSPFYEEWVDSAQKDIIEAQIYLQKKDLKNLGPIIQRSYLKMFATMETSIPPIFLREPMSMSVIKDVEILRQQGLEIWETMDAGPQVKLFCLKDDVTYVENLLSKKYPNLKYTVLKVGQGVSLHFDQDN